MKTITKVEHLHKERKKKTKTFDFVGKFLRH